MNSDPLAAFDLFGAHSQPQTQPQQLAPPQQAQSGRRLSFSDLAGFDNTLVAPAPASTDNRRLSFSDLAGFDTPAPTTTPQPVPQPAPQPVQVVNEPTRKVKSSRSKKPKSSRKNKEPTVSTTLDLGGLGSLDLSAFAKEAEVDAKEQLASIKPVLGLSFVPSVSPSGLKVTKVEVNQAAAVSGIRVNDVILSIGNTPVADSSDFFRVYPGLSAGDKVPFQILRSLRERTIEVIMGGEGFTGRQIRRLVEQVEAAGGRSTEHDEKFARETLMGAKKLIGMLFAPAEMGKYCGLLVTEVKPNLPAFRAGLQSRDLITHIDNKSVASSQDFYRIWTVAIPGDIYPFTVVRGQRVFVVPLTVGADGMEEVQLRRLRKAANLGPAKTQQSRPQSSSKASTQKSQQPDLGLITLNGPPRKDKKKKKEKKKKKKERRGSGSD